MYQKILVPLDGSALAECILPHVKKMVQEGFAGEVVLLRIIDLEDVKITTRHVPGFKLQDLMDAYHREANTYLSALQARLGSEGIAVKTEVAEGIAAQTIAEYANRNKIDLIVIATHGYTGMKRLMFGSVALRVMHDAHVPVLLIRPESCRI